MYRGRLWTMRQFAGFGSAEETNQRYKYLLEHGETGLSVAFDYPTLYGYDTDHPMSRGEFGKCGVAISSLEDMEILFSDIPIDKVTTSMTINGPAAIVWGFYIANAENRGISKDIIGGTIQNDILKEYIAQKSYIFPPEPSMRLIVDTFEFGSKYVPRWNTISISVVIIFVRLVLLLFKSLHLLLVMVLNMLNGRLNVVLKLMILHRV